ncbi:hypothetical protein OGAPHI_001986 [Ogataea philodendri]|uniref:Uncharacterized protein n=1 Tax=Ogataea philodendri TaxID=1378263 RepID=A0A9P8PBD4_9ASCO|nr:uncharacterized protein OGAPHI_001986 [Ogataea philodendri]KAH3668232.1 hypothetical protein OGAPHI_001986 [Ogataea philodendri]
MSKSSSLTPLDAILLGLPGLSRRLIRGMAELMEISSISDTMSSGPTPLLSKTPITPATTGLAIDVPLNVWTLFRFVWLLERLCTSTPLEKMLTHFPQLEKLAILS